MNNSAKLILNFAKRIYDSKKILLLSIFVLSIFCSLIFLVFFKNVGPVQHRTPGTDYFVYYEPMADSIIQGKGITVEGRVLPRIAPGWPVILSVVFSLAEITGIDRLDLIVVFNVLITALASCCLFFLAKEVFNKKIALVASFLWMTYPFNLWFIKNPNTEVPFLPLFFTGVWIYILVLKKKKLGLGFLAGIIFGVASLVRLISLFLPLFLALLLPFFLRKEPKKRRFLLVAVMLIGTFITLSPWTIYTLSKAGSFVPVSDVGKDSVVLSIILLENPGGDEGKLNLSDDVLALIQRLKNEDTSSGIKILNFFSKELVTNPLTVFELIWLKLSRAWYATSKIWWEKEILTVQILYLIASIIGIIYAIRTWKDKINNIIFLLAVVLYFWAITALSVSIMRYMVPAMGLIVIFSAVTVGLAIDKILKKKLILHDG